MASPARPCSSVLPSASSRLSTSVSTRETKNDATEWRSSGRPASRRRSIAATNASMTRSYWPTLNSSVTLMFIPSNRQRSIAGSPASVAGILIIRFGRSTSSQYMWACSIVPSVSCASRGATSQET